mmetsp:Transcript_22046/g.73137  ORF Transcript_22046/g.73137 Transcript_22046/m.73137 type:complete len:110 (+) Transcript_22046:134-463(+)
MSCSPKHEGPGRRIQRSGGGSLAQLLLQSMGVHASSTHLRTFGASAASRSKSIISHQLQSDRTEKSTGLICSAAVASKVYGVPSSFKQSADCVWPNAKSCEARNVHFIK